MFGNNYFNGKKPVNAGYRKALSRRFAQIEEDFRQQQILAATADTVTSEEKPEESKNIYDHIGGALGTAGNLIKDAAVDAYESGKNAVVGTGNVLQGNKSARDLEKVNEERNKVNKEFSDYQNRLTEADYAKPEVQKKLKEFQDRLKVTDAEKNDRKQIKESSDVDAKKLAGDVGETYLNLATLGTGTVVKQAGKGVLKAGARAAAEGTAFGAAGGALGAAGDDESVLEGAAEGALFGGVLGGVSGIIGKGISNKIDARKDKKAEADQPAATTAPTESGLVTTGEEGELVSRTRNGTQASTDEIEGYRADFDYLDNLAGTEGSFDVAMSRMDGLPEAEKAARLKQVVDLARERGAFAPASPGGAPAGTPELAGQQGALPEGAPRTRENEVVEVYNPTTGEKTFYRIPEDQRDDIVASIDGTGKSGLAGERLDGEVSHITARTPEYMAGKGFTDGGVYQGAPDLTPEERLEALNAGKLDDDLYDGPSPEDPPEKVLDDLVRLDPDDSTGIRQEFEAVLEARRQLDEDAMENDIMTRDRANRLIADMDERFALEEERINAIPSSIIRKEEMDKLDAEYADEYRRIEEKLGADSEYANMLEQKHAQLDDIGEDLATRIDTLRDQETPVLRTPNEERIAQRRAEVEAEVETVRAENAPEAKLDKASDEGTIAETIDRDPDVQSAARNKVEELGTSPSTNPQVLELAKKFLSPSHVFEKMGLRSLHTNVTMAVGKANNAIRQDAKTIETIKNELGKNKGLGDEIIDYLDGKTDTISRANEDSARLIKDFLDEKKAWLQENGFKTREDYFPHMFDKDNERVQRLFGNAKGEYSFGNVKERKFEGGDYNRNIVEVLSRYSQGFNRMRFMNPALKELEDNVGLLKDVNNSHAAYIQRYIEQIKSVNKDAIESVVDDIVDAALTVVRGKDPTANNAIQERAHEAIGRNHYRNALGIQRMVTAVAIMGGNASSAIRNGTSFLNNIGTLGPKYAKVGAMDSFALLKDNTVIVNGKPQLKEPPSPIYTELIESGIYDGGLGRAIDIDETDLKTIVKSKADKISNGLMIGIRSGDIMARTQAYLGARAKGEELGLKGDDLKRYATERAIDTQFITSKVDMPMALNGATMRSLAQLMSYTVKQAEYLTRITGATFEKGADGKMHPNKEGIKNIMAFTTASAGTAALLGPVIGFDPIEMVPFADQFKQNSLYRAPIVKLMFGDGRGKVGFFETVGALQEAKTDEDREEAINKWWNDNYGMVIPAGTQIKKTIEGTTSTATGESLTAKGNLRFYQNQDAGSQLQAALFGQYATENGQEWLNNDMPNIKADTTVDVDGEKVPLTEYMRRLPIDSRERYYNYFAAKQGINDVLPETKTQLRDRLTEGLKSGKISIETAAREAKAHNKRVTEYMKKNYGKSSLPDRLAQDMTDSLLVDVFKIEKSAKRKPSKNALDEQEEFEYDDLEG